MTTTELTKRVEKSYREEFDRDFDSIHFDNEYKIAWVIDGNSQFSCFLNTRGVKKNSWRLDHYN